MPLPKSKPEGLKENIYADIENTTEHKIYNTLVVIQHLMTVICPDSHGATKLLGLIRRYNIDTKPMGFPENW